jgi:hypothetical protein
LESPGYEAVTVSAGPIGSFVDEQIDVPPTRAPVQSVVVPIVKLTVPVGSPLNPVTVAW